MEIAIIGYGRMGKMIESAALSKGHRISAIITSSIDDHKNLPKADVCIDFSRPEAALENLKKAAALKINVVMGTTGWYEHLEEAKSIVDMAGIGFLYSPNFSIGVALFLKLVTDAAALISATKNYEVAGLEIHHSQKLDAPSGTAKAIIDKVNPLLLNQKKGLEFSAIRVGNVPGTHSLIFDSPEDTITLTHTARNREGFATGAILAAEWLAAKKGFFTINNMLEDMYGIS